MNDQTEKPKIPLPVIVEGRYDKIRLDSVIEAKIVTTDGFGIFKSKEKKALLKKISEDGVIVMTDSDGAGRVIRSHLSGMIPPDKIYNLYVPRVEGKEKRKKTPSKEGILGVEGTDSETLKKIFSDFLAHNDLHGEAEKSGDEITKTDFFEAGLTGAADSRASRDAFAESIGLPPGMTPNALLCAVNIIMKKDEFINAVRKSKEEKHQ